MTEKHIAIIGAGFGGLGAAIRLAARGHHVEIFERRDKPGGRAYVYEINGFKFDGGPTVITAPFLFDDLFTLAGRRRDDYVRFVPVSPFYRIFNAQGQSFDYNSDLDFTLRQIERISPGDREGYLRFLESTRPIFEKGFVELAGQPFLSVVDMLKVAPDLIRLQSYKSVYAYISQFIQDEFLRQIFSFHPLLVGGNPYDTASIYAMIHYLEREWGVHYAIGGTGAIVDALVRLFGELGGKIHLSQDVVSLGIDGRRLTGLYTRDGRFHPADIVVSNADVANTYLKMIPANQRRRNSDGRLKRMKYSMSLFVYYFGTKKRFNDGRLAHHNILLGPRYKGLLDDIFNKQILADDFSLYLHMPTLTDPSIAPEGCEGFYVLAPAPNQGSRIDWTRQARPYRDRIVRFLEENYLPGLEENIIAEHWIDPLHFEGELNSYLGSAFSFQPVLTQSAWFRPHNRSEDFDNLYFVGAGTHPGAGLPGVLSSAVIAERLIEEAV
ncbi:MAG TPA: phytoene desaturase [Anaerolineaceae bacterium]|nr:phytoene desaturase [Anaerolineaceae bacterium]